MPSFDSSSKKHFKTRHATLSPQMFTRDSVALGPASCPTEVLGKPPGQSLPGGSPDLGLLFVNTEPTTTREKVPAESQDPAPSRRAQRLSNAKPPSPAKATERARCPPEDTRPSFPFLGTDSAPRESPFPTLALSFPRLQPTRPCAALGPAHWPAASLPRQDAFAAPGQAEPVPAESAAAPRTAGAPTLQSSGPDLTEYSSACRYFWSTSSNSR